MSQTALSPAEARGQWIRENAATLWQGRWIILAVTAVAIGGALFYSVNQTPTYESHATLLVQTITLPDGTQILPVMDTEKEVAGSPAVASLAIQRLGIKDPVQQVLDHLSVDVPLNTQILDITYSAATPSSAQRRANAFAFSYLAFHKDVVVASFSSPPKSLRVGRVLQPATLPTGPSSPSYPVNLVLAGILGLAVGVGLALFRERLVDPVRGPVDLERYARVPVLATVPTAPRKHRFTPAALWVNPESALSTLEPYRTLRAGLVFATSARGAKTILVTSSRDGEGKSTVSANLGASLAEAGKRVILVSADLRRPQLERLFECEATMGLTDVLSGEAKLHDALIDVPLTRLQLLPTGRVPGNKTQLLGSTAMHAMLTELHHMADFVLIDAAPILGTSDAIALAPFVDAVLFVADPDRTDRRSVARARRQLELINAPLIGSVLNRFNEARSPETPYFEMTPPHANGGRASSPVKLEAPDQADTSPFPGRDTL